MGSFPEMERPSGKGSADENFPVGSWLLPGRLRTHIARFYAYARAIDDIADDPELAPREKIRRLNRFADAVKGIDADNPALRKAHAVRRSLDKTRVTHKHCVDLTVAFKQDATKLRYADWDELIGYCNFSAAPVGRYLVDLNEQPDTAYPASDALCNALQVLNHIQDCRDDYMALNRVYLPLNWMKDAGSAVEDLAASRTTPALRQVLDRCLDATDRLLSLAEQLPGQLPSLRFAMESAAIVAIARELSLQLRRRDPLAERVELGRVRFLACCLRGAGTVLFRRTALRTRSDPGSY